MKWLLLLLLVTGAHATLCADPIGALMACCQTDVYCSALLAPQAGPVDFWNNVLILQQSRYLDLTSQGVAPGFLHLEELACTNTTDNCVIVASMLRWLNKCDHNEVLVGASLSCQPISSGGLAMSTGSLLFDLIMVVTVVGIFVALIYWLWSQAPSKVTKQL